MKQLSEHGQALVILAMGLVVVLVCAGLILDGAYLWLSALSAQEDLDAAVCGIAAGVPVDTAATIVIGDKDVRGTLTDTTPTFLLQLTGWREFTFTVKSRCLRPRVNYSPVCVKTEWFQSPERTILGAEKGGEQQADDSDFTGACLPWIQGPNHNVDPTTWYPPIEPSQSPNPWKDTYRFAVMGSITTPFPSVNTHIATLSGVSNKFVVDAFRDAGIGPGDDILVLEFSGEVLDTDPGYPPISNVKVLGYAIFHITDMGTNWLQAEFVERVTYDEAVAAMRVQQVPWSWLWPAH